MKIVLNKQYGGFGVSSEFLAEWNVKHPDKACEYSFQMENYRTDADFVDAVEQAGTLYGGFGALRVITFPDTATDWMIEDYDGLERVIYVVDGKLHTA